MVSGPAMKVEKEARLEYLNLEVSTFGGFEEFLIDFKLKRKKRLCALRAKKFAERNKKQILSQNLKNYSKRQLKRVKTTHHILQNKLYNLPKIRNVAKRNRENELLRQNVQDLCKIADEHEQRLAGRKIKFSRMVPTKKRYYRTKIEKINLLHDALKAEAMYLTDEYLKPCKERTSLKEYRRLHRENFKKFHYAERHKVIKNGMYYDKKGKTLAGFSICGTKHPFITDVQRRLMRKQKDPNTPRDHAYEKKSKNGQLPFIDFDNTYPSIIIGKNTQKPQ